MTLSVERRRRETDRGGGARWRITFFIDGTHIPKSMVASMKSRKGGKKKKGEYMGVPTALVLCAYLGCYSRLIFTLEVNLMSEVNDVMGMSDQLTGNKLHKVTSSDFFLHSIKMPLALLL